MYKEQPDDEIVLRCLEGEIDAFSELVERYQKPVFRAIVHMVGDYEDAKELSQQVFLRAYENLASFDRSRKFFSWIYRIAVNETINFLKRRHSWEPLAETVPSPAPGPSERLEISQRSRDLRDAIGALSLNYRTVIVLRHFFQFSYTEAAEMLGIPEKAVKSRLFTARQLLKQRLELRGYGA